jgi:hypothetical protein
VEYTAPRLSRSVTRITVGCHMPTHSNENWLQRVRYTAAEPTAWLLHARKLRQAAEDLWNAGNFHARSPGSELGAAVLVHSSPGFVSPDDGGGTRDVCFMVIGLRPGESC